MFKCFSFLKRTGNPPIGLKGRPHPFHFPRQLGLQRTGPELGADSSFPNSGNCRLVREKEKGCGEKMVVNKFACRADIFEMHFECSFSSACSQTWVNRVAWSKALETHIWWKASSPPMFMPQVLPSLQQTVALLAGDPLCLGTLPD